MSIIFGKYCQRDCRVSPGDLQSMSTATIRYAPEGATVKIDRHVGFGMQPYFTHDRSRLDPGPLSDARGNMLAFDGRLDNQAELRDGIGLDKESSDGQIILAWFSRYGERSFGRFIGDWSFCLWSSHEETLYLCRDHAGTRTLYYGEDEGCVTWSTALETFFHRGHARKLDEVYALSYLSCAAIGSLTPYVGIRAVRPGHGVALRDGRVREFEHWHCLPKGMGLRQKAPDYETEFRSLFLRSIERRVTPGDRVVAQLSGGMDSSAIVCMHDAKRREEEQPVTLNTLSFFNDSEPNWNERPYFELVEADRGRRGVHFDVSSTGLHLEPPSPDFYLPGANGRSQRQEEALEEALGKDSYRVILSGIGGDELLGGVPDPTTELAEYVTRKQFGHFFRQALAWSLVTRMPIYHHLLDAMRTGIFYSSQRVEAQRASVPWLHTSPEGDRHRETKHLSPASRAAERSWWSILETLPHLFPNATVRYEYRYPFLDRELVEFLMNVPSTILCRPGRRRALMRSALRGIVPNAILERRRKAFVLRQPLLEIERHEDQIMRRLRSSLLQSLPYVDPESLFGSIHRIRTGETALWRPLRRAISLDLWLETSVAAGRLNL